MLLNQSVDRTFDSSATSDAALYARRAPGGGCASAASVGGRAKDHPLFFSSFKKGGSIIAFCWLVYMTIRPKSWLPFFFPSVMAMCALITWQDHHPSAELSFFFFFFRFGKRRAIWTVSIDEFVIKGGTTTTILKFSNGPFYTLEWAALEWSAFLFYPHLIIAVKLVLLSTLEIEVFCKLNSNNQILCIME